ncbi:MAG: osmoprotectant transport system substrate-binding protein opuBD [Thermoleophilaceae bacterium]|jgi:glycine betaine/choline ABC-type transport system substrate-binding protein|nr:osmoprotectant transport system substrate-binding protein opuBD [Thermoleophilaceae bacterium]
MTRGIRALVTALSVFVLAIAVAACGSSDKSSSSSSSGGSSSGNAIKKNSANAGKSITVGSKNFTEQFILGEIYSQALQAAGYKVKKKLNLGSEVVAYKALKTHDIDAFPEYTGTTLTSDYGVKVTDVPKDANQAYDEVKTKAKADKITAMPQAPFDNTYRLGMTKAGAAKIGNPTKISDLKGKSQNLVVNGFPECRQRPDCLLGVQKTYGLKFKKFLASEQKYEVLDKGQADVAFVFTTDANLATNKYVILDDDKKLFPPYHISFMIRDDVLSKLGPDAQKVVTQVQSQLTDENMRELNSRVDLDKKTPKEVASEYLKEGGYVK